MSFDGLVDKKSRSISNSTAKTNKQNLYKNPLTESGYRSGACLGNAAWSDISHMRCWACLAPSNKNEANTNKKKQTKSFRRYRFEMESRTTVRQVRAFLCSKQKRKEETILVTETTVYSNVRETIRRRGRHDAFDGPSFV